MAADEPKKDHKLTIVGILAAAFLIWAIVVSVLLGKKQPVAPSSNSAAISSDSSSTTSTSTSTDTDTDTTATDGMMSMMAMKPTIAGENVCYKKKLDLPNIDCITSALDDGADVTEGANVTSTSTEEGGGSVQAGAQAGANVTQGYNGDLETDVVPITSSYLQAGLCPVNVHWHLGSEHYSAGEYDCEDEEVCGPSHIDHRRALAGKARKGYQCNDYDAEDPAYTTPYEWKFCDQSMEVGQTYEVHWPHSAAGDCGTPNQYQTPFYDGVFCNLPMETLATLKPQDIASNVGVQAQIFTIVNDEAYYYPDLIRGMIVEPTIGAGQDMAIYTGSTTGTSRNNTVCSSYTPITWQVDRKCQKISASSFDKMCADMMSQRADMSDDLYAHGSRELVADFIAANNHQNLRA